MSEARAARRPAWPAIVFLTVAAQLLLWNLWSIYENEHASGPNVGVRVRPRSIENLSLRNDNVWVRTSFGWDYRLRALGAGSTLVIPPELAPERFYLTEVSRLHVEVAPPVVVPQQLIDHVGQAAWPMLSTHRCAILAVPGARRYVTVETEDKGLYLVLPEARLRQEAAWYQEEWPFHPDWPQAPVELPPPAAR